MNGDTRQSINVDRQRSTAGTVDKGKSIMNESNKQLRQDILQSLFREHINLTDEQLAPIVGFPPSEVSHLRRIFLRAKSVDHEKKVLSWDYVLCFVAGSDQVIRKPTSKEIKNRNSDDTSHNDEWANGMTQKKYFSQIFYDIWKRLEFAKLNVKAYRSSDGSKMFLVVGITELNLRHWADERDTDLEINPVEAVKDGRKKEFPLAKRTKIADNENLPLSIELWRHLFVQYNPRANPEIYLHYDRIPGDSSISTIFDEKTRLRIMYESIISDSNEGGAEVTIQEYIINSNHPLKAVFPLHNKKELEDFDREWIRNWRVQDLTWCPLDKIRSYFGEPVAFYFGFLSFYIKWLIYPSILGLIFFFVQIAVNEIDVPGIELVSFFIIFWSVAFIDFWIRQEAIYRLKWGMTKFQQKAVARPQFRGEWKNDEVSGAWTEHFSVFKRSIRISSTLAIIAIFIAGCIASVMSILLVRDDDPNNLLLKIGLGVANGVIIFVFDVVYSKLSHYGNDFENHRTEEDYLNAMITKSFIFKFFNSFASLLYLAFVRPAANGKFYYLRFYGKICAPCHEDNDLHVAYYIQTITNESISTIQRYHTNVRYSNDYWKFCYTSFTDINNNTIDPVCTNADVLIDFNEAVLNDVRIQLVTLFLTAIFIQNTLEVIVPYIIDWIRDYRKRRQEANLPSPTSKPTEIEEQWQLQPFVNTLDDMSELIIQFGYVTLFVIALPITPLLALINNIIEIKVDAINVVKQSQRPNPNGSYGIGAWNQVLQFFSIIAVATNVAMMTWTTQFVDQVTRKESGEYKWIFFSVLSIVLGLIIGFEKFMIPDVPEEVLQAIERQRLIENVLVLGAKIDAAEEEQDTQDDENDDEGFSFNPAAEFISPSELEKIPTSNLTKPQKSN